MRCLVFRQHHYILQISSQSTLLLSGQVLKCKEASSFKWTGMGIFIDEAWGVKKSGLVLVGGWGLMNVPRGVQPAGSDYSITLVQGSQYHYLVQGSQYHYRGQGSQYHLHILQIWSQYNPSQSGGLEVPSLSAPIVQVWCIFTSAWYFVFLKRNVRSQDPQMEIAVTSTNTAVMYFFVKPVPFFAYRTRHFDKKKCWCPF